MDVVDLHVGRNLGDFSVRKIDVARIVQVHLDCRLVIVEVADFNRVTVA
jgi:hypothetical protein